MQRALGVAGAGLARPERATLDLTRWGLIKIDVDVVGQPTALCPGQPVQVSIAAEAQHRERDKARLVQTYEGKRPGLGARNKLGFESFSLHSAQGRIDEHGWFTPSHDPFVSVEGSGGNGGGGALGGAGGPGGTGGAGGPGGAGGQIQLVIDDRFPELEQVIRLDVAGGSGGSGGSVGDGGVGGSGGHSSAEETDDGPEGADGSSGANGRSGPTGTVQVRLGSVDERFSALPAGLVRL